MSTLILNIREEKITSKFSIVSFMIREDLIIEENNSIWYHPIKQGRRLVMAGMKERIQAIRKELDISQRDFAKRAFISKSLLCDIEQGNRSVNDRTIQLISTEFNVNKDWLLTGNGEMFTSPPPDIQLQKLIEIFNQLDQGLRDCLLEQSKALLKIRKDRMSGK